MDGKALFSGRDGGLVSAPTDAPDNKVSSSTLWWKAAVLGPLALFLVLFVWLLISIATIYGGPSGGGFGTDFSMFYAASRLLHEGRNPYDHAALFLAQKVILQHQGLHWSIDKSLTRVGNPPLFFWALEPLARLPFRAAGWIWSGLTFALCLVGFLCLTRYLGWRRWVVPLVVFMVFPQIAFSYFYGNPVPIIFATMSAALLLSAQYPVLAGAMLASAWLKPSLALPFVALILAFHVPASRRRACSIGFVVASVLLLGLTLITTGVHSLVQWGHSLLTYSNDISSQPEIATLAGLYVHWAPASLRLALNVVMLLFAVGVTVPVWLRYGQKGSVDPLTVAWLWCVWFLASPYAHGDDMILLTLPFLSILGRDAHRVWRAGPALMLYLLFLCFMLNQVPGVPVEFEGLKLGLVTCILYAARRDSWFSVRDRPSDAANPAPESLTPTGQTA